MIYVPASDILTQGTHTPSRHFHPKTLGNYTRGSPPLAYTSLTILVSISRCLKTSLKAIFTQHMYCNKFHFLSKYRAQNINSSCLKIACLQNDSLNDPNNFLLMLYRMYTVFILSHKLDLFFLLFFQTLSSSVPQAPIEVNPYP